MCDSVTFARVGSRLDLYVSETEKITRSAAQNYIDGGNVLVNGEAKAKNYKLRAGDVVTVTPPPLCETDVVPQEIPLDILYEDRDLLVVNKPKGMVVHPAPGNPDGTLVNALLWHCKDSLSGINGVLRPGIVHRIDKDTSGLLLVAKNDLAHTDLAEQISSHRLERCYQAIVHGGFAEQEGTVDAPIGRHPVDRKKMAIVKDGRNAVTHYTVLSELAHPMGKCTHLQLQLKTGRTHQIRVHMNHLGHPLLGDQVYGLTRHPLDVRYASVLQGQCLHAKTVAFVHPVSKELLRFDSPLPCYFETVLQKLKDASL